MGRYLLNTCKALGSILSTKIKESSGRAGDTPSEYNTPDKTSGAPRGKSPLCSCVHGVYRIPVALKVHL